MSPAVSDNWTAQLREYLSLYHEPLLRQVASRLIKPRNQWPTEDLIDRMVETVTNAPVIDRRLKEQPPPARQLLALIGYSGQNRWFVGSLIELVISLGHGDGWEVVNNLLESGLLFPELFSARIRAGEETSTLAESEGASSDSTNRLKAFDTWLTHSEPSQLMVFCPPDVTRRALGEEIDFPDWPPLTSEDDANFPKPISSPPRETDGLELLIRMAVLWQQTRNSPLRKTQQGDLFKRDIDRLLSDPLLNGQPSDHLESIPNPAILTVALALCGSILQEKAGEYHAFSLPEEWTQDLPAALACTWTSVPFLGGWTKDQDWLDPNPNPSPLPAAYLLFMILLSKLPNEEWTSLPSVINWVLGHHPFWQPSSKKALDQEEDTITSFTTSIEEGFAALERFAFDICYQFRWIQATKDENGSWLIRLSPLGRWILQEGEKPTFPSFTQTMVVQPNLEILLYRQGATPELIAKLSQFASWKGIGAACNLQLQADEVYAALEAGESFSSILQTLNQHGMKATPDPVVESLRTWAQKRERITLFTSATVLEFLHPDDLTDAVSRGVPLVRINDHLAAIANENDIDFRQFRLTASRDYTLPPEQCVTVENDGITLKVDLKQSDLMLESEISRFADEIDSPDPTKERCYRITPDSLERGLTMGLTQEGLEIWFQDRTGLPISSAVRLLLTAKDHSAPSVRKMLVVQVANLDIADGLMQWPGTRSLISERLGPVALVVEEDHLTLLREKLHQLGVALN